MHSLIQQHIQTYDIKTALDEQNAVKQALQEALLYALSKTNFFEVAFFCGRTCLRIAYGLDRFSEDLDFSLLKKNESFDFDKYVSPALKTLADLGLNMKVSKSTNRKSIQSRNLKENFKHWKFEFQPAGLRKQIVIKLEVDIKPPNRNTTQVHIFDFPLLHGVLCADRGTLLAGKLHALLCRPFCKGRDWYDFLWHTRNKTRLNLAHLICALEQAGPYQKTTLSWPLIQRELKQKINQQKWPTVAQDVQRFLRPDQIESLNLWSHKLFLNRLNNVKLDAGSE